MRSGSLLDRGGDDARYVLAGDVSGPELQTAHLTEGLMPLKTAASAALLAGDVVVSLRGTRNPAAAVPSLEALGAPLFATLDVAVIRIGQHLNPAYLSWFLNLPGTQDALAGQRSGSAAPRLPLPALRSLNVPVPPRERQEIIVAAAATSSRLRQLSDQLQSSRRQLFDVLLRRAAEEGSVTGGNPTRTDHRPNGRGSTMRALSNPDDRKEENGE